MLQRVWTKVWRAAFLIPALVVGAAVVLASRPILAGSGPAPAGGPSDAYTCTPVGVAVFDNRVHVRCSAPAPGGIFYFAYCSTTDSGLSSRFLSVFTTAKATAKNLVVYYSAADTSGESCGCSSANCRVINGAEVQQ